MRLSFNIGAKVTGILLSQMVLLAQLFEVPFSGRSSIKEKGASDKMNPKRKIVDFLTHNRESPPLKCNSNTEFYS